MINNIMIYKKVEGYNNLYKDPDTNLIVNIQSQDRNRYRLSKQQAMSNINSQYEIENLKSEISDIKDLLNTLINKL